jgi:hypothetical protein
MAPAKSFSLTTRVVTGTLIILLALMLLAGGWTIPFQYESFSILYKFGLEKTFLRTGKMVGITLVLLVFFQILLASRFTLFERTFSVKAELRMHRAGGMVIAGLALVHPLLIKASENFTPYTLAKKYYPEFLGIGLLCILLMVSGAAIFRSLLKVSYPWWLLQHRLGATLVCILLPTHVLWVSDTFKIGPPRTAAVVIFCLILLLVARIWLRRLSTEKK